MGIVDRIKGAYSAIRGQPLDGYPAAAVAADPFQFWQRGMDRTARSTGTVAAVESCIDAYVQAIAQLPGFHFRRKDDGGKELITTSALSRLLKSPNGYQTSSDFLTFLVRQLLMTGKFCAVAARNDRNEVSALHPFYSNSVVPYIDRDSGAIFYAASPTDLVNMGDARVLIPARDVLHVKLYTPRHPLEGVSPITYAAMSVAANSAISGHQAAFFNNMSRPSFILSTDAILTTVQMKQLREAWESQSTMMESGGVPILAGGLKAQQLGLNSQDSQLVEAFRMTVEDIARAFRVPGQLVGLSGTYNSTEQLLGFWLATGLGYMVNHIELALDKFFNLPASEFVEFDTDMLMRVDLKSRLEALSTATQNGIMSPNEARSHLELSAVEHGDEPRMQAQCVPLSSATLTPSAPAAPAAPAAPVSEEDDETGKSVKADGDIVRALVSQRIKRKAA